MLIRGYVRVCVCSLLSLFQSPSPRHPHCAKKVLDFGVVCDYVLLDLPTQWRLAKFIGTTPAQIVDNIKRTVWATQMH